MLTFIGTYGQLQGFGTFAPYLLIIQNGSSIFGRLAAGFFADKIGIYNMVIMGSTVIAIMFWVWLACTSVAACIVLVVIIGVASGAFISLQGPMATMTAKDMRYGGTMVGQALCESLSVPCADLC
jgi:MFS family permease